MKEAFQEKNVEFICYTWFKVKLTPMQVEIVRKIAFSESKRLVISCMTRYGKSYCVAMGVLIYIFINRDKRILLLAPQDIQTGIIKNYLSMFIVQCEALRSLVDIALTGLDRLKSEVSKKRITFKNGCEVMTLSAEGEGTRLMGFGGDLIICLPYNAMIHTDKGILKVGDIVEKRIDCKVLSYNHQLSLLEYKDILKYEKNPSRPLISFKTDKGSVFSCTVDHPVYVFGKGYIRADSVVINDKVMGLGKDLNTFDVQISNNDKQMRNMRKRILYKTKPSQKNKKPHLLKKMPRINVFKKLFKKNNLQMLSMQKKQSNKKRRLRKRKKELLFNKLPSKTLFWRKKPSLFKDNKIMLFLQKTYNDYSLLQKPKKILQQYLQRSTKIFRNARKKQYQLARRIKRTKVCLWFHKEKKAINKGKLWEQVCSLSKKIKKVIYSSYRLRQKQSFIKQFNPFMCKLSRKNKLQQELLAEKITKISNLNAPKYTYNLEVKDNKNYFCNGVLLHNCDEDCLIKYDVYRSKISRMLGDNPDSIMISIGNPWNRNNQMWKHWTDPNYKKIYIDWKIALEEGRTTQAFIDEQRNEITSMEFKVLYDAEFPEEAEDSIFRYQDVKNAVEKGKLLKSDKVGARRIISCDVADKGMDLTVIMWGYEINGEYIIEEIYKEDKSDNMQIAGKIIQWYNEKGADAINIDTIGVGVGVVSRVKEVLGAKKSIVKACHFGESAGSSGKETKPEMGDRMRDRQSTSAVKRFMNKKAEQYFRLKDLFEDGMITIPKNKDLMDELMKMTWELTSGGKIRIIDPEEKSPDYADALVYFIWKDLTASKLFFGKLETDSPWK